MSKREICNAAEEILISSIESGMAVILVNCTLFLKYHRDILILNLFFLHTNSLSNRLVQLTFTRIVVYYQISCS